MANELRKARKLEQLNKKEMDLTLKLGVILSKLDELMEEKEVICLAINTICLKRISILGGE